MVNIVLSSHCGGWSSSSSLVVSWHGLGVDRLGCMVYAGRVSCNGLVIIVSKQKKKNIRAVGEIVPYGHRVCRCGCAHRDL